MQDDNEGPHKSHYRLRHIRLGPHKFITEEKIKAETVTKLLYKVHCSINVILVILLLRLGHKLI